MQRRFIPKCLATPNDFTLPETNIFEPKNGWLEDSFLFGMASWQVRTVSFMEGKLKTPAKNDQDLTSLQVDIPWSKKKFPTILDTEISQAPFLRCAWKPGGSSLAPYFEGILDTSNSLAPFQAPARFFRGPNKQNLVLFSKIFPLPPMYRIQIFTLVKKFM